MISIKFTQEYFNQKAQELINISTKVNDTWKLIEKESIIYLTKKDKIIIRNEHNSDDDGENILYEDKSAIISNDEDIILIEYHVLFHPNYQVPCLCFNAYKNDKLINIDDISNIFKDDFGDNTRELYNKVSQMEHPIIFKPFFMIHPCKSEYFLKKLKFYPYSILITLFFNSQLVKFCQIFLNQRICYLLF